MYIIACRAHFFHLPGLGQVGHSPRGTSGSAGTLDWSPMWSGSHFTCHPQFPNTPTPLILLHPCWLPMPPDDPLSPYTPTRPLTPLLAPTPLHSFQSPDTPTLLPPNVPWNHYTPWYPWASYTPCKPPDTLHPCHPSNVPWPPTACAGPNALWAPTPPTSPPTPPTPHDGPWHPHLRTEI